MGFRSVTLRIFPFVIWFYVLEAMMRRTKVIFIQKITKHKTFIKSKLKKGKYIFSACFRVKKRHTVRVKAKACRKQEN